MQKSGAGVAPQQKIKSSKKGIVAGIHSPKVSDLILRADFENNLAFS